MAPITTAALLASRPKLAIRVAATLCTRNSWSQRASASNSRRSSCRLGMLSIDASGSQTQSWPKSSCPHRPCRCRKGHRRCLPTNASPFEFPQSCLLEI
jgi:hypothetical protein